jgi:TetR/AcrR family acrAB operon transcriptional repressor
MVRRTKEEAQETRNRILDFAEHVFGEKGVSRTSLDDLARAAGVTRGAIYWHFRNKAELFDAMMARITLPMEEVSQRATGHAGGECDDPLAYVRGCALNVLLRTATDPRTQRVFDIICHKCEYVDEMAELKARHLECRAECLDEMQRAFAQAIAKGQLPATVDARRAAVVLHALIDGLIANWVLDTSYHPLAQDAENIIDGYLAGLMVPPALAVKPAAAALDPAALRNAPLGFGCGQSRAAEEARAAAASAESDMCRAAVLPAAAAPMQAGAGKVPARKGGTRKAAEATRKPAPADV